MPVAFLCFILVCASPAANDRVMVAVFYFITSALHHYLPMFIKTRLLQFAVNLSHMQ